MITNMPLQTYETYYLDYLFSNHKFTAIFLTSRRLHSTGTVPVPWKPYTVGYGDGVQPYDPLALPALAATLEPESKSFLFA